MKNLKEKFLNDGKLNLIDKIRLGILRRVSDCDGMCHLCSMWYCETYKKRNKGENYE